MTHASEYAHTDSHEGPAHNSEANPANRNVRTHSGQGHLVSNLIAFILCMIPLLASFWCFGLWISDSSAWLPFAIAIILYGLTFLLPMGVLRGKTAKRSPGGTELTQL